ncbi:DUF4312 family protein [Lactobacillus kullabergensis]|uniref:DUF4312 family protein n=1 Tax=Lactobacillus kullabergensis TaxID=1218493 RepID=A0ABN5LGE3_9LACO|nr:DUF4312 family protein [Lactobacillus kullabergensis]AWM74740.1 hypothetical protein DKL58_01435 [Lactobacillus kullabergensis]
MKNVIQAEDRNILVKGKAKNKKEAFANAINQVARNLGAKEDNLIFKIEPKSFEVEELKEIDEKEHFLFFFFPRIRKSYEVQLRVLVHVEYVCVNEIDCQKVATTDNPLFNRATKGV